MLAAAAKYPDWVCTAQAQIDEVCGKAARLPTFDVNFDPSGHPQSILLKLTISYSLTYRIGHAFRTLSQQ